MGLKRPSPKTESAIYVQSKSEKIKVKTEVLVSETVVPTVSTKEKTFVVEVEPATFSTLNEKGSTVMKKLLEMMAFLCCIYEVDFSSLVEADELCSEEDFNGKVDFLLVCPRYNVRRNRNTHN